MTYVNIFLSLDIFRGRTVLPPSLAFQGGGIYLDHPRPNLKKRLIKVKCKIEEETFADINIDLRILI